MNQDTDLTDLVVSKQPSNLKNQAKALLERLTQTYPVAFLAFGKPQVKPLKLGIHKELLPIISNWGYNKNVLKYALGMYTRQLRYQLALAKCRHRIDLLGEPAGEISDANRQTAQEKVDIIREKRRQSQGTRHNPKRSKANLPKKPDPEQGVSEKAFAALKEKLTGKP